MDEIVSDHGGGNQRYVHALRMLEFTPPSQLGRMPTMNWEVAALVKLARQGAICFLPTSEGKYLLQDDAFGTNFKPKLRPPGGGREKEDASLTDTIARELHEEMGIDKDKVYQNVELAGYSPQRKYFGTAV